jgi:hypothetical protein
MQASESNLCVTLESMEGTWQKKKSQLWIEGIEET